MEFLKSNLKQLLATTVIYAAVGVFFVLKPDTAFVTIGKMIAVCLLVAGVLKTLLYLGEKNYNGIQRNTMTSGIILIVLGVFMLVRPQTAADIVGYILAFVILIAGILKLQYAVDINHFKGGNPTFSAVFGVIGIVLGIVALLDPFSASKTLLVIIGISMIITAVGDAITALNIYGCLRKVNENIIDAPDEE